MWCSSAPCLWFATSIQKGATRLVLSNDEDFDRVDAVRAECDAILVGANAVLRDNPRLMVRSQARRDARVAAGLPATPIKVALSRGDDLDPTAAFFTTGDAEKIIYCETSGMDKLRDAFAPVATVVDAREPLSLPRVLADLASRSAPFVQQAVAQMPCCTATTRGKIRRQPSPTAPGPRCWRYGNRPTACRTNGAATSLLSRCRGGPYRSRPEAQRAGCGHG
jgi:hypothetical protein